MAYPRVRDGHHIRMATPPWKRKNPRPRAASPSKMTADQIARARVRAARAGRRYPNLVDNMAIIAADKAPSAIAADKPPAIGSPPPAMTAGNRVIAATRPPRTRPRRKTR